MLSANLTDGLLNKCPKSSKYLDSNIIKHHQIVNIQVPAVWALLKFLPSNSRFENPCQHRSDHSLVKNLIFKLWCMQMSGSKPDSFLDISCFFLTLGSQPPPHGFKEILTKLSTFTVLHQYDKEDKQMTQQTARKSIKKKTIIISRGAHFYRNSAKKAFKTVADIY